jgi:hypothetical protein
MLTKCGRIRVLASRRSPGYEGDQYDGDPRCEYDADHDPDHCLVPARIGRHMEVAGGEADGDQEQQALSADFH